MSAKTRYAVVGIGSRSQMFIEALVDRYCETGELVAFCDNNPGRVQQRIAWAADQGTEGVQAFTADEFDRMISETRPDVVIVTTKDAFHDEYICRAMELGCDVITEKPMTTDAAKCQRIIDTQQRTGRHVRVTFNYRYSPVRTQVKELLMSGVIGAVLSVDFHWLLDTRHGADYFRRWHRNKANSGGLMVHKATHHFDLINWWLSTVPTKVYAQGHRRFYTPQQGDVYGLTARTDRCLTCPEAGRCPFYLDLTAYDTLRQLYVENEQYDGYHRDQCVFSPDMDIEDSMNVVVDYANGAKMSYSLNSFMPWEGYIVSFNGTKGRLEHKCEESVYISGDDSVPGALKAHGTTIHIFPHFAPAYGVDIWEAEGGHGGGDAHLLQDVFLPQGDDKYLRAADHRAGAYSILTGIAANQSMATGQAVNVADLVHDLAMPEYTAMPQPTDPNPLPR